MTKRSVGVARLRQLGRIMDEFRLNELTADGVTMRRFQQPPAAPAPKQKRKASDDEGGKERKRPLDALIDSDPDFQDFEAGGG